MSAFLTLRWGCLHFSLLAGPHPRSLSLGDFAPRSGPQALRLTFYLLNAPRVRVPDVFVRLELQTHRQFVGEDPRRQILRRQNTMDR
jgi:hypothetical protein